MRYRILGPLEVQAVVDHPALRRRKPRIVLAALLLHANEVVSTESLIDALWEDERPETAPRTQPRRSRLDNPHAPTARPPIARASETPTPSGSQSPTNGLP